MMTAEPVQIAERSILIRINQMYYEGMSERALYEATRGVWVIGAKRDQAQIALAVSHGIVREVYRIQSWYPGGTLDYHTRESKHFQDMDPPRWEFEGVVAHDLRNRYVGKSVAHYFTYGNANPIKYVNL
jgi:hypothetical protein